MATYLTTSAGDHLITSAGDSLITSLADATTGVRATLAIGALRRETYSFRCPTCMTVSLRDGRVGARNQAHTCRAACFSKARQSMVARGMLSTGGAYAGVWRHAPPRRGGLA